MNLDWRAMGILIGLFTGWSGFLVGMIRMLLGRMAEELDHRLEGIEKGLEREAAESRRLEQELMALRADLPVTYVRREDAFRTENGIHLKLDGLESKIDGIVMRFSGKGDPPRA